MHVRIRRFVGGVYYGRPGLSRLMLDDRTIAPVEPLRKCIEHSLEMSARSHELSDRQTDTRERICVI